jgi:dimethylargininase
VETTVTDDLGPQNMVDDLTLVAVKAPGAALAHAGPDEWQELGWHEPIDADRAEADHAMLVSTLEAAGAEVLILGPDPRTGLDSIYAHDAGLVTPAGVVPLRSGKQGRAEEGVAMVNALASMGVPVLAGFDDPTARADGGDFTWLDSATLIVGHSFRTNAAGIAEVRRIVEPQGVEVVAVDLPYWHGPSEVLHLMSFISMVDHDLAVVYPEMMPVRLATLLTERGIGWVEVPTEEFPSQGCNVLALGPRHVLALGGNPITRDRMEAAGCTVESFDGTELSLKGDGGPTCLTRPLRRAS